MSEEYEESRWCNNCQKYTMHTCVDCGHERDSSGDREKCNDCGFWMTGFDLKQNPPWED